ncbi:MAG: response regulator [Planctomycetes bacterium]|nr:response regulator [Planctomycetota bacterium]
MVPGSNRLLIVDDEPDTCANLSDIFTDLGYQVDVAHDGLAALELVGNNTYDVALLDLKMPGMDGLELYRRIRRLSAGTVAIVVTAYANSATATSVLDSGAWKILSKPVDFPLLLGLVEQATSEPLVLIVDDDQDLCDSLWDLLRERSYRVSLSHDLASAAGKLQQREYNVVLIDMKLPESSGSQVLEQVRKKNPEARTILITGHRDEMERRVQEAMANGAEAVCYKPFDMNYLLETIRNFSSGCSAR